jgi:ribonuclease P protein component
MTTATGKFSKGERLCSRKAIERLFASGNSLFHHPFRLIWIDSDFPGPYPVRLAISVPARKVGRAVHRNHIKRLIRESFRTNKAILYEFLQRGNMKIDMMLIYVADEEIVFNTVNTRLKELMNIFTRNHAAGKDNI